MPLSDELSIACPASTYSVAIRVLLRRRDWPAVELRARLRRAVDASLRRGVAAHDDRGGQAAALVVARTGAVPVVARAVELERRRSLGMVHEPDEHVVAVARQDRTVRVLVVVDERELDRAPMRQDQDPGLVDQLVLRDADRGAHLAVGPLLGVPDGSAAEYPAQRHPVLLIQTRYVDGSHQRRLLVSDVGTRTREPRGLICRDRIPVHWPSRRICAEVPFAPRGVPLVPVRAPLVGAAQTASSSSPRRQALAWDASPASRPSPAHVV